MNGTFEHGVIIGRFNPPHCGHSFLIDVAMRCSRTVTLFLCSLPTERIPGELRVRWLREMFPKLNIVHITTANSQAAQGNSQAIEIWARTIRDHLTSPADALFASEYYGAELADRLGTAFFPVDPKRQLVSVSGRLLRKAPFRYWHHIPSVAKAYFVLPIIIDAPAFSQGLAYATAIAHHVDGALFSPPKSTNDNPALLQRYLAAQMTVSYRTITLYSQQYSNIATLLPQTYFAPLYISIHHIRHARFRITVRAAEGRPERVWNTYRTIGLLKRICRYYLQ